jgi:hypothetical protein
MLGWTRSSRTHSHHLGVGPLHLPFLSSSTMPRFICVEIDGTAMKVRDGNSGMSIWYLSGIWSDGYGYGDNFLPVDDTRSRYESTRVRDGYFFSPVGNPTGTRYFTTAIILGCEQVKMCSFSYINYDLFWLLNFATLLSQIFVEY